MMRPQIPLFVATSILAGIGFWLVASVGIEFMTTADAAAGASPALVQESSEFNHKSHVPAEWWRPGNAEVPRDCRGCHDYSDTVAKDPEASCKACHTDLKAGGASLKISGNMASRRNLGDVYAHKDHLGLDCRACHLDPKADRRLGLEVFTPQGTGWCVACHDPKSSSADKLATSAQGQAKFQAAINASPAMKTRGDVVFLHSQHMKPGVMEDPKICATCHSSLESGDAMMGAATFNSDNCGECHLASDDRALEFIAKSKKIKSPSDLSFFHRDHVGANAEQKSSTLAKKACMACHSWSGGAQQGKEMDYPVRPGFDQYQRCVECHDNEKLPIVEKSASWTVADHGDIEDKNTCKKCHTFGDHQAVAKTRPKAEVKRSRPAAFMVKEQVHPHITGNPEQKSAKCSKCHVAEIAKIPSRIRNKRFRHDVHLSANADPKECQTCHLGGEAKKQQLEQAVQGHSGMVNYNEKACAQCHRGVERMGVSEYRSDLRPGILFDHNDHIGGGAGSASNLACDACHVQSGSGDRDFSYKNGIEDCSACHNHTEHAQVTGGKDQAYVQTCTACHEAHKPGIPAPKVDYFFDRVEVASVSGDQFHPLASKQACVECHVDVPQAFAPKKFVIKSERSFTGPFHSQAAIGKPSYCYACHWGELNGIGSDTAGSVLRNGQVEKIPAGSPLGRRSNVKKIREQLGSQMKGFPGQQK